MLNHPAVTHKKLGGVGFCMGGQFALLAGTTSDHIGAVVDFYGIHPQAHPDFSKLTAPVLGLFGQDPSVPPTAVQQLETAVQQADGTIEIRLYTEAGYASFNDTRPEACRPQAAQDAWQRCLTFLQETLA